MLTELKQGERWTIAPSQGGVNFPHAATNDNWNFHPNMPAPIGGGYLASKSVKNSRLKANQRPQIRVNGPKPTVTGGAGLESAPAEMPKERKIANRHRKPRGFLPNYASRKDRPLPGAIF